MNSKRVTLTIVKPNCGYRTPQEAKPLTMLHINCDDMLARHMYNKQWITKQPRQQSCENGILCLKGDFAVCYR